MDDPKSLTASGLLYEGNFDEWWKRMQAVLAQHHSEAIIGPLEDPFVPDLSGQSHEEMTTIIWWQTSPYIRHRIPEQSRTGPCILLKALRQAARPFRFSDLPPEIRTRIYTMLPSSKHSVITLTNGLQDPPRNTRQQRSMMCVNSQIRAEIMPGYHKDRCFQIAWRLPTWSRISGQQRPRLPWKGVVKAINSWASVLRSDSLRSLRHLCITIPASPHVLKFSLLFAHGTYKIRCTDYSWLRPETQVRLLEHADEVSSTAQFLKLEGEALIMVVSPGI